MIYGVHTSTAGNLPGTPARAKAMGADALQIFMGSPRSFNKTVYEDTVADAYKAACDELNMPSYAHMMYLTAYGTPDEGLRQRSVEAARHSMSNAEQLGILGVVTHMGSHKGEGLDAVMPAMVKSLSAVIEPVKNGRLLLEISAGSGNNIGNSIEELAAIYEAMGRDKRIGFCLDTCHMLAAGYDVASEHGWDEALKLFDKLIGLDNLPILHLNDSKHELGSKRDRHENIGKGFIGEEGFRVILNHPDVKNLVGILEVPGIDGKGPDKANLDELRRLTKV
jgi:deoxyribonuclease IV